MVITLKEALARGILDRFIAEREDQPHADQDYGDSLLNTRNYVPVRLQRPPALPWVAAASLALGGSAL